MIALLVALVACAPPEVAPTPITYPRIFVSAADKPALRARLDEAPGPEILAALRERAERPYLPPRDPAAWDEVSNATNGETAQDAAMLAWLLDDEAMAAHAIALLDSLPTDFETNRNWDVNIRMPAPLFGFGNAIDLLRGTPFYDETQAQAHIDKLVTINDAFWRLYLEDDVRRQALLGTTQNNHPIRTAAAIASIALFYPESRYASAQADWAISELDYLWGPDGRYVQPDGGVSEGPFYYGFGLAPTIALFIGMDHAIDPNRVYLRDCRNRQDFDPWGPNTCVEGEPFVFDNPLHRADFAATLDWWIGLRLPGGLCPPLADSYFNPLNGAALVGAYTGDPQHRWSWETSAERPMAMTHGLDLIPYHLALVDDAVPSAPPEGATRFFVDTGNAVLRSGWGDDDRWLMLVAEHGAARKTVHDHVDGLSFSMAAYGEYLLVDPGYHKVNELTLPETAQAPAHNVVLVDGRGAPAKGLLTDFGDADAFLVHSFDGARVDYVEAHQRYEGVDFERSAVMLRERYFVIADRTASTDDTARRFTWRLGGYAGFDSGGAFSRGAAHATWERERAGVTVHLASTAPSLTLIEPPQRDARAPHVHRFALDRALRHHAVVDGEVTARAPGFLAVLAPYRTGDDGADGPLAVTPLALGDGVAGFLVETADATDLVLLRSLDAPTTFEVDGRAVTTDGALAIVSLEGPPLAVLARGATLEIAGTPRAPGAADAVSIAEN